MFTIPIVSYPPPHLITLQYKTVPFHQFKK